MNKVVHLIPFDGIGGVETAARSMGFVREKRINFQIYYIYKNKKDAEIFRVPGNFLQIFFAIRHLLASNPDMVIASLWRSSIVGIIFKLLRPQIRLVTFLHSGRDAHFIDYLLTRISLRLSSVVWTDSSATAYERLGRGIQKPYRVISFVTQEIYATPVKRVMPRFIYWGRINQAKGLVRAICLFSDVAKSNPDAHFLIVGPDDGGVAQIIEYCEEHQLADRVVLVGAATQDEIVQYAREASFYLQTSEFEGMAMSVVESMQLGLVPVVTPVGEVARYCQDGVNSILVGTEGDLRAVTEIKRLLDSDNKYGRMRANAIKTWAGHPLYRDSVIDACVELLFQ